MSFLTLCISLYLATGITLMISHHKEVKEGILDEIVKHEKLIGSVSDLEKKISFYFSYTITFVVNAIIWPAGFFGGDGK